ncbi:MAG: metallophosphoesterase [Oscillospiraceae bacterium]|nr:metallophosphoesterase [Oscillospiraceae bacterium]
MGVFVTGDTHGDFRRLKQCALPEGAGAGEGDYVIVCGDFGGVWDGGERDAEKLDRLDALPFTTVFVDGNHENFDELCQYPVGEWRGGRVHRVRPGVLHLMRGQIFELEGLSFFTMGGGRSTDTWDGLLDPEEPDFAERYWSLRARNAAFRVKHLSWWEQELPSAEEYAEARQNLNRAGRRVDYILTHCAPDSIQDRLGGGRYRSDELTRFLEEVKRGVSFRRWFFGHYHYDTDIDGKYFLLHQRIVRVI